MSSFYLLPPQHVKVLFGLLVLADTLMVLAYLIIGTHMVDLAADGNIPTMYSVLQLLLGAILLYIYGRLAFQTNQLAGVVLLLGATIFLYLATDEGGMVHEFLARMFDKELAGGERFRGQPKTGIWILVLAPVLLTLLVSGFAWLRNRIPFSVQLMWRGILGACIYVGGGASDILTNVIPWHYRAYQVSFEEGCEMLGISIMVWTIAELLSRHSVVVTGRRLPAAEPIMPVVLRKLGLGSR